MILLLVLTYNPEIQGLKMCRYLTIAKKIFSYVRHWASIDIKLEIIVWRMTSELKYFDIFKHSAVDCCYYVSGNWKEIVC